MMRWILGGIVCLGVMVCNGSVVGAESLLRLQPLEYVESLQKAERKKAFIDVTNPTTQPVDVTLKVQAFKQIDDQGTLSFYDDARVAEGIQLDYDEVTIPAQKTLRLFFVVDGSKLPTGDVFAAIFAQTTSVQGAMAPSVRVGTLLILTNETPGARQAAIESLTLPAIQVGDRLTGEVKVKNTAPTTTASGFFPEIQIQTWPFGTRASVTGPLVYAGNTRTVKLDHSSSQFGIYKITASYGTSHRAQWVLLVTGVWRGVVLGAAGSLAAAGLVYRFIRHRRSLKA